MSNKIFTSKTASETIDKIHNLLGMQNNFYMVARLAISIWLIYYSEKKCFIANNNDAQWKEFNEYTILNDSDGYKTALKAITQSVTNNKFATEDEFFSNQWIVKKLIDDGCILLERIYEDSWRNWDLFLKKLYSYKFDKDYKSKIFWEENTTWISKTNNERSELKEKNDEEAVYINWMKDKVKEFLENFNYQVTEVGHSLSNSVLRVKIKLPLGKSISQINSKVDDLKLHLGVNSDIIIEPISWFLCFDIPRMYRETVFLKDIIDRIEYSSVVKFPLWISVDNEVVGLDLADSNTPHLLIAGSTGQWKSECLKSIIGTLIIKNDSNKLKLILIDPKKVEFSRFKKIPHLEGKIITEIEDAIVCLENAVQEMEKRYDLLNNYQVNHIDKYNELGIGSLPHQVIVFDEFADFILSNKKNKERIESAIKKLCWKARAAGIHLILSTQRPDKDIVTGVIKANLPAKIAFKTSTVSNSQIVIENNSAYKLFGKGDMLLSKEWSLTRVQWAFISDWELDAVIEKLAN